MSFKFEVGDKVSIHGWGDTKTILARHEGVDGAAYWVGTDADGPLTYGEASLEKVDDDFGYGDMVSLRSNNGQTYGEVIYFDRARFDKIVIRPLFTTRLEVHEASNFQRV